MNRGSFVLGIDPGFASVGVALVRLDEAGEAVLALRVIRTAKSDKKREVRASDDNLRRAREIAAVLDRALFATRDGSPATAPTVRVVCAESMSFPRHAGNAAKMAMCWGVIATLAAMRGVPVVQASPKEIKLAATGSGSASKEDVAVAMRKRYGATHINRLVAGIGETEQEHAFDALAAVVACLDSEIVRLARRVA